MTPPSSSRLTVSILTFGPRWHHTKELSAAAGREGRSDLWIDFRKDAVPKESNKLRPGIVVEDSDLFAAAYPNVVVVPCTTALTFEVRDLSVQIAPDDGNGFDCMNWAIAHNVTTTSKARIVKQTGYHISAQHLVEIRARILETVGC